MKIFNFWILFIALFLQFNLPLAYANGTESSDFFCQNLHELKKMPHKKGVRVKDPIYNGLMKMGEKAIPCLIDKLTDKTPMPDPRQAPKANVLVGDVAFFMLWDITERPIEESLPPAIRKTYKTEGIWAYIKYVENDKNRIVLQKNWQEWCKLNCKSGN